MQNFTSSATSINRSKLPSVYRKATLSPSTPFVVDYGCGKYVDHIKAFLKEQGKVLYPFDPYNQPDATNKHTLDFIQWAIDRRIEVDLVCSNVLNVIDDPETIRKIANYIQDVVKATDGTAYITVYEGDRSGIGRQTGRDQYQRNEPLRSYLKYFPYGIIRNGVIVVRL